MRIYQLTQLFPIFQVTGSSCLLQSDFVSNFNAFGSLLFENESIGNDASIWDRKVDISRAFYNLLVRMHCALENDGYITLAEIPSAFSIPDAVGFVSDLTSQTDPSETMRDTLTHHLSLAHEHNSQNESNLQSKLAALAESNANLRVLGTDLLHRLNESTGSLLKRLRRAQRLMGEWEKKVSDHPRREGRVHHWLEKNEFKFGADAASVLRIVEEYMTGRTYRLPPSLAYSSRYKRLCNMKPITEKIAEIGAEAVRNLENIRASVESLKQQLSEIDGYKQYIGQHIVQLV